MVSVHVVKCFTKFPVLKVLKNGDEMHIKKEDS
jgi:hypothetical protein